MWKFLIMENVTSPHLRAGKALGPPCVWSLSPVHLSEEALAHLKVQRPWARQCRSNLGHPPAPTACQAVSVQPRLVQAALRHSWGASSLLLGTRVGFGTFCPSPWLSPLFHLPGLLRMFPVSPLSLGLPSLA